MFQAPFVNIIDPTASRLRAVDDGFIFLGKEDTDPTVPANQIPVYYTDENGNTQQLSQPIQLNATGVPVLSKSSGTIINPIFYADVVSIVIKKKGNKGVTVYSNKSYPALNNYFKHLFSASGYSYQGQWQPNIVIPAKSDRVSEYALWDSKNGNIIEPLKNTEFTTSATIEEDYEKLNFVKKIIGKTYTINVVDDFGAKGYPNDDYEAIQNAITYSESLPYKVNIEFPANLYQVSKPLVMSENDVNLIGLGYAIIQKTTHATGGLQNKDCTLYMGRKTDANYLGKCSIKNISLYGISMDDKNEYTLYLDKVNQLEFDSFDVQWGKRGIHCNDGWLCGLKNIDVRYSENGIWWLSGTTFTATNVWVRECDYRGWYFVNTSYSTLAGCGADKLGNDGTTDSTAFFFDTGCEFTLNGTACESNKGTRLDIRFSYITVNGWEDFNCKSADDVNRAAIELTGSSARLITNGCKFTDYVDDDPQNQNIKLTDSGSGTGYITKIESTFPTNGANKFPGTVSKYGIEIEKGEIKQLISSTNGRDVKAQFVVSGTATASNGDAITHGLGSKPKAVRVFVQGSNFVFANALVINETQFTVGIRSYDGALGSDINIYWEAVLSD